jgi:hypothetical protein
MKPFLYTCATALWLASCQSPSPAEKAGADSSAAAPVAEPAAETAVNTLSDAEKAEGWILLFDGQSKSGWHVYQGKSDGSAWKAENGTLMLDPKEKKDWQTIGGGDLVTDSAFQDYHLSLEWKISPKGNSGIIFGIQDQPTYEHSWHTGMEMQVLDNAGHSDAANPKHRAGDLYDLISSSTETVKPAGEWNRAEVKVDKGKLDLFLNGTNVVSTTLWDENWKKLVAGSKFREWTDFATFKSGHIGLQDHGDPVWFRNIRIRKL